MKVDCLFKMVVLATLIFLGGCQSRSSEIKDQVCFKNKCVNVEIVKEEEERHRGLQFREFLDQNSGMLFIFPTTGHYGFWMKNTLIPLDIIWMDYTRRIVHIETNVPPCRADPCANYSPGKESLYALEVNAFHSEEMGLKVGDRLDFKLRSL